MPIVIPTTDISEGKEYVFTNSEPKKYVSAIRKELKTVKREWNPNNKFHSNRGATF